MYQNWTEWKHAKDQLVLENQLDQGIVELISNAKSNETPPPAQNIEQKKSWIRQFWDNHKGKIVIGALGAAAIAALYMSGISLPGLGGAALRLGRGALRKKETDAADKSRTYVRAFASLPWNWQAMIRAGIVNALFYYPKETYVDGQPEHNEDWQFSIITKVNADEIPPDELSPTNLHTGNKPDQALFLRKLKNTRDVEGQADWYNGKINQVYDSIQKIGKTPEDFGGRDIRKENSATGRASLPQGQ